MKVSRSLKKSILIIVGIVAWAEFHSRYIVTSGNLILPRSWLGIYLSHTHGNGAIILVRRSSALGAFQLIKGGYRYLYREDGGTKLEPTDPAVHSGEVRQEAATESSIKFGPFNVKWSFGSFNRRYLYYDRKPTEASSVDEQEYCVLDSTNFAMVGLAKSGCVFRASN